MIADELGQAKESAAEPESVAIAKTEETKEERKARRRAEKLVSRGFKAKSELKFSPL